MLSAETFYNFTRLLLWHRLVCSLTENEKGASKKVKENIAQFNSTIFSFLSSELNAVPMSTTKTLLRGG